MMDPTSQDIDEIIEIIMDVRDNFWWKNVDQASVAALGEAFWKWHINHNVKETS